MYRLFDKSPINLYYEHEVFLIMDKKIGIKIFLFWIFQSVVILVCHKILKTSNECFSGFLLQTVLWHIILLQFLMLYKNEFVNTKTGEKLEKINLANTITISRLSSVPLVAFLLKNHTTEGVKFVLAVVLFLMFLTDFFDGLIARKCKQETFIGKMLDPAADYSLLLLLSMLYYEMSLLPNWFFFVIFTRLILQAFGAIVFVILDYPLEPRSTIGGKITVATTMMLYMVKLIEFFVPFSEGLLNAVYITEYVCGAVIFVFTFEKINIMYKHYLQYKKKKLA